MAEVAVWTLFAYMTGDDTGEHDERRMLAEWQIDDALRWCRVRGYDNIYLSRDEAETARFEKRRVPVELIRHHV